MSLEFRVLGPVEALEDGKQLKLGGAQQRKVLAVLLLHAGQLVTTTRLIDEVWAENAPDTAGNIVQGYVSHLRKALGRDAITTKEPGYTLRIGHGQLLDLHSFERLASDGAEQLERGSAEDAAALLHEALALWRGPALADVAEEGALRAAASRLDELRLLAVERRIEADLRCGRHADLVAELDGLVSAHPLRERLRELQMLALYRCGRQADALAAYRVARESLVDELGIEPGSALQGLERAILQHDPALDEQISTTVFFSREAGQSSPAPRTTRTILVAALDLASVESLTSLAEPLVRVGDPRELVLAATVTDSSRLADASARLKTARDEFLSRGDQARAAAFTSVTPGIDLARLAKEQDAELLVVDAPDRLLEDPRLLSLLDDAPCDVAVLVDGERGGDSIVVPFAGADHDWSAVQLGAWLSLGTDLPLRLAGAETGPDGRDASRLLASASLAAQRAFGVHAEPLLVSPAAEALGAVTSGAAVVVVGLTERWRREGVGRTRTALAVSPDHPTLLVRRGLRPGGLAPRGAQTRFTWTIGAGGL